MNVVWKCTVSKNFEFKPAWWLPGGHLQTIYPVLTRRQLTVPTTAERLELDDGDFIDINWAGKPGLPIVIVLHGLAGSIESPYARGLINALVNNGKRVVFMHFRGCSGEPNRLQRSYHSGETGDLNTLANIIKQREPSTPLFAVGYSLGGNVLLKWLGETKEKNILTAACAISVPFELGKAAVHMQKGISRFYQSWLLSYMREAVRNKFKHRLSRIDLNRLSKLRTFWHFDDNITAPLHGFRDACDYYQQSSSRQYLQNISIPTLIIHAKDDPLMPLDVIPTKPELSPYVTWELYNSGGHVGFITGNLPGKPHYWLEKRIPDFFKSF